MIITSVINFVGELTGFQNNSLLEKLINSLKHVLFGEEFVEPFRHPAVDVFEGGYLLKLRKLIYYEVLDLNLQVCYSVSLSETLVDRDRDKELFIFKLLNALR